MMMKSFAQKSMHHLDSFAAFSPLGAALIAPIATLYDIPALTQRWYSFNGVEQPDPTASLILSGFTLAFSLLANILLVLRFTVHCKTRTWQAVIIASTAGWTLKTAIGIANLITFGALTRNQTGYTYIEGFWCAVLSLLCSGVSASMLILHLIMRRNAEPDEEIKFEGRTFILSEVSLFGTMALEALIFSQIEGWTYLEGLYFAVVAILTIGFGDYSPTYTSTKILLFPFAIAGFALLSNQISLIVGAVSSRVAQRRQRFYFSSIASFEKFIQDRKHNQGKLGSRTAHQSPSDKDALRNEIRRLKRVSQERQDLEQLTDLAYSAAALIVFWLIGAVIYHFMEGWSMGNSLYFNYVFFLTIGFGDYSPQTPAGKAVFILWAMMDVPIMTTFVVQTIQTIVERMSKWLALTAREKRLEREHIEEKYFVPHDEYLGDDEWWEHVERGVKDGSGAMEKDVASARRSNEDAGKGRRAQSDREQAQEVTDVEKAIDRKHQERAGATRADSSSSSVRRRISGGGGSSGEQEQKVHDYALDGSSGSSKPASQRGASLDEYTSEVEQTQRDIDRRDRRRQRKQERDQSTSPSGGDGDDEDDDENDTDDTEEADAEDSQREEAIERLLSLCTYLEAQARSLLIENFKLGSPERLLLQADANVQTARLAEWGEDFPPWMDGLRRSLEEDTILDRVKKYRITYARVLVNGSKVLKLQGERARAWERRRVVMMGNKGGHGGDESDKSGGEGLDEETKEREKKAAEMIKEDVFRSM